MSQIVFIILLAASLAFFSRTMWLFGRACAGQVHPTHGRGSTIYPAD